MKIEYARKVLALTVVALLTLSSSLTYAYSHRDDYEEKGSSYRSYRDERREEMEQKRQKAKEGFIEELGLDSEQVEILESYRKEHRNENKESHEALKELKKELQNEIAKPESDTSKIRAITSEIKQIQANLVDARTDNILKVKEVLTPEQFEKFQEHHEKMKDKREGRRKEWMQRRRQE